MLEIALNLPGIELPTIEVVRSMSLTQRVERSIRLLQANEPKEGYSFRFSGGKDSVAVDRLLRLSGCRFEKEYNFTTIDPPELLRFIKEKHPDAIWNRPQMNMMHRVATRPGTMPTRRGRWCCEEYKEAGGDGRVLVLGTRAAESPRRKANWREVSEDIRGNTAICPVVYWTDAQLWEFILDDGIPYCSLYDEGFTRLGCVDCPLASNCKRQRERERWPIMAANWKRAAIKNWQNFKDVPNSRTGEPRFQAKFKTGEDYYLWWINESTPDELREDCQSGVLFTNEEMEGSPRS